MIVVFDNLRMYDVVPELLLQPSAGIRGSVWVLSTDEECNIHVLNVFQVYNRWVTGAILLHVA